MSSDPELLKPTPLSDLKKHKQFQKALANREKDLQAIRRKRDKVCQSLFVRGARCSSMIRAFAHGAMGRRIDPSWREPIELFLVPASPPRLV